MDYEPFLSQRVIDIVGVGLFIITLSVIILIYGFGDIFKITMSITGIVVVFYMIYLQHKV